MKEDLVVTLARRLMSNPAIAFHESAVQVEVEAICREHRLASRRDRFGNILVELRRGRVSRPTVLMAHMDHPGFEITGRSERGRWRSQFLGGVPPEYFRAGTRVRLMPQGVPAKLGKPLGKAADRKYELQSAADLEPQPRFAVWELEDFGVRGGRVHGRACDDLIGVASVLATLIRCRNAKTNCWVIGAITRAEEIGFGGALALASSRSLPANSLVISLETSRELAPVRMGDGVIVRVGDRSSVFDSQASRFLCEVANDLAGESKAFQFQRALMQGGSCEATVFVEAAYQTTAVCVALGNYHNCGPRKRIAAEYVSVDDARSMVELLAAAATRSAEFDRLTGRLRERLKKLDRASRSRLLKSARAG